MNMSEIKKKKIQILNIIEKTSLANNSVVVNHVDARHHDSFKTYEIK